MTRLLAGDPQVDPYLLDHSGVKGGLLELAKRKADQQLLAVHRVVLLLHHAERLLQTLVDDLPQTVRGKVVGKYSSVDWPSSRRAKAASIDKLPWNTFADGSKR